MRQIVDDLLVDQTIGALSVPGVFTAGQIECFTGGHGNGSRHVFQAHLGQQGFVFLLLLAGVQRLGLLNNLPFLRLAHGLFELGQFCLSVRFAHLFQAGVRLHHQTHPVRVVQQPFLHQVLDKAGLLDFLAHFIKHRVQVQQSNGVTPMHGGGDGSHHQLQTIGVVVATDFTLTQLQLMQSRLQPGLADAVFGHFLQHFQNPLFQFSGVPW